MIGKKSKFEQHERDKVQVQDNSNTTGNQSVGERKSTQTFSSLEAQDDLEQTTNGGEEPGGRDELSEQTLGSEAHQEEAQDNQEEVQLIEGNPTVVRSSGKYSPFTPDNKEDVRQEQPGTVSSDTSGTNTSSTIPGASAGVTILVPSNIKTDTELLWDEICNGVKGKNSGIPMGFNRLNKYLGLRKSIYTTIGAAAG